MPNRSHERWYPYLISNFIWNVSTVSLPTIILACKIRKFLSIHCLPRIVSRILLDFLKAFFTSLQIICCFFFFLWSVKVMNYSNKLSSVNYLLSWGGGGVLVMLGNSPVLFKIKFNFSWRVSETYLNIPIKLCEPGGSFYRGGSG